MTESASALQGYRGFKVSEERLSYISYIHLVHLPLSSGHTPATTKQCYLTLVDGQIRARNLTYPAERDLPYITNL